jgi:hypothetical protein
MDESIPELVFEIDRSNEVCRGHTFPYFWRLPSRRYNERAFLGKAVAEKK